MPRLFSFSRLSLAALLLMVLGSVAWAKPKVAILGLEAINAGAVDPKDAANASTLTEALRAIPRGGIGKYDFAANSTRELQDEKLMGNCDSEKAGCMAPIGAGLGAEVLIYGNIVKGVEKGKDGYKVTLNLLVVKPPKLEETEVFFAPLSTFAGGAEPVKEWAQKAYAKLTGEKPPPTARVETGPGKLIVSANAKNGDVFIGASKKGRLADGTITLTLPEGPHELAIEAPGYKRYEATVTIKSGTAKTVDAVLEEMVGPVPPPIVKGSGFPVLKATGYGLAGLGVAAGVYVLYLTVAGPEPDYAALPDGEPFRLPDMDGNVARTKAGSDQCNTALGAELKQVAHVNNYAFDEACKANKRRWVVGGLGIASGVLAAGALYFAYRSDSKSSIEKQSSAAGRRTRRQLTVTPVISPSGGGATVRFDW